MIREEKLPDKILDKIPGLVEQLKIENDLEVFYLYGSGAKNDLKPLSDLDFAVLLDLRSIQKELFRRELDYRTLISTYLNTDEYDLIILNKAPLRFVHSILKEGKMLYYKNQMNFINYTEQINYYYLDFKFYKSEFNKLFLEQLYKLYG
jgi:predicted nucleotidyltransferase